ncbi:hypothetical protein [Virgisporangium ochraceum]|nr:hypothetical protein [Virgisporangium ochraceum]
MTAGALRLLLLALLSIGVIGMHTVGHASDHTSGPSGHRADAAVTPEGDVPRLTDAGHPCDGTCGGGTVPVGAVRSGPDPDPAPVGAGLLVVCLAVLGGLGVLALLAGARAARRPGARPARVDPAHPTRAASAPVPRFPMRLLDVAVLRT